MPIMATWNHVRPVAPRKTSPPCDGRCLTSRVVVGVSSAHRRHVSRHVSAGTARPSTRALGGSKRSVRSGSFSVAVASAARSCRSCATGSRLACRCGKPTARVRDAQPVNGGAERCARQSRQRRVSASRASLYGSVSPFDARLLCHYFAAFDDVTKGGDRDAYATRDRHCDPGSGVDSAGGQARVGACGD